MAAVIQKNDSTYQADTQHGKRTKVKAANVFAEFDGDMAAFLEKAQNEAAEIDTDLLWETCSEEEFTAAAAAEEYFGHTPSKTELAATLIALYAAPMYFYKKAKGVFKAAPEETLKQALAAIERKKQQEALMEEWTGRLKNGELPPEIAADLPAILHMPDKQSLTYKAFAKAADSLNWRSKQAASDPCRNTCSTASNCGISRESAPHRPFPTPPTCRRPKASPPFPSTTTPPPKWTTRFPCKTCRTAAAESASTSPPPRWPCRPTTPWKK